MDDSCATIEKYELRKFLMLRWLEVEIKLKTMKEKERKMQRAKKMKWKNKKDGKTPSQQKQKKRFRKKLYLDFVVCLVIFCFFGFSSQLTGHLRYFHLSLEYSFINCVCMCVCVLYKISYNLIESHIHKTNGPVQQLVYKGICAIACITRNLPKIVCIKIVVVMCCPIYIYIYKLSRPLVFYLVHMARFSSHSQSDFHRP